MSDFEMPYFIDGGGNKGYFKDSTARDQIETTNEKIATKIGTFTINATNHPNATNNLNVRQTGNVVSIQGFITGLTVGNIVIGKISGVSLPPTHIRFLANSTTQPWETGDSVYAIIDMTDNTLTVKITKTALNISVTYIV